MSNPDETKPPEETKPPPSKTVQICTIVCVALGIGVWQGVGPILFPSPPGGGFNMMRIVGAAIVGAVCGVIGVGIGKLIDSPGK